MPETASPPPAAAVILGATEVRLRTSDGLTLDAWYATPAGPHRTGSVLVANGNAGNRSGRAPLARALAARGLSVLLFDYRGYGGNPGSPSEAGLARDARAAYRFLAAHPNGPVLFFGESLGSAVVTELASEYPPDGLVLRSPFVDLAAVGRVHYPYLPVRTLLRDRFRLVEHLSKVSVPTVVVYGSEDSVVPPDQSRRVAEAAPGSTRVVRVPGADHNDPALLNGTDLVTAVVELAERVSH
ncbi:MAG TPA: alpha/beta fold hydrolase [Micromonosporaceae bacterium]